MLLRSLVICVALCITYDVKAMDVCVAFGLVNNENETELKMPLSVMLPYLSEYQKGGTVYNWIAHCKAKSDYNISLNNSYVRGCISELLLSMKEPNVCYDLESQKVSTVAHVLNDNECDAQGKELARVVLNHPRIDLHARIVNSRRLILEDMVWQKNFGQVQLLLQNGVNANKFNEQSPLHIAIADYARAQKDDREVPITFIRALVNHPGIDLDLVSPSDYRVAQSPLYLADSLGLDEVFALLRSSGAKIYQKGSLRFEVNDAGTLRRIPLVKKPIESDFQIHDPLPFDLDLSTKEERKKAWDECIARFSLGNDNQSQQYGKLIDRYATYCDESKHLKNHIEITNLQFRAIVHHIESGMAGNPLFYNHCPSDCGYCIQKKSVLEAAVDLAQKGNNNLLDYMLHVQKIHPDSNGFSLLRRVNQTPKGIALVLKLLQAGANPNGTSGEQPSPLGYAIKSYLDYYNFLKDAGDARFLPLRFKEDAAFYLEFISVLIASQGSNLNDNQTYFGKTPLALVCDSECPELFQLFLETGARIYQKSKSHPLRYSMSDGKFHSI